MGEVRDLKGILPAGGQKANPVLGIKRLFLLLFKGDLDILTFMCVDDIQVVAPVYHIHRRKPTRVLDGIGMFRTHSRAIYHTSSIPVFETSRLFVQVELVSMYGNQVPPN